MANNIRPAYGDVSMAPADGYVAVTKANGDLPEGTCRSLLVGTAGTANLTQADGTERDGVPLQVGYNPIVCKQVRLGGTAAGIWALY